MHKTKKSLNELRQTKEYSIPNVEYTYVESDKNFKEKVINLRRDFPNDKDFGKEVAKLIFNTNIDFPGVQNL